jgi:hypothetical protein
MRRIALLAVFGLLVGAAGHVTASPQAQAKVPKDKRIALDWLGRPETLEKFGKISDTIWGYAELAIGIDHARVGDEARGVDDLGPRGDRDACADGLVPRPFGTGPG